jgi:ectoine hydroxylase-related dioxygenase (phytanoyl-CoA dioxygenase family)
LSREWIDLMGRAVDRILTSPGSASIEYTARGQSGRFFADFFLWMRDPDFEAFMKDSPLPEVAACIMGAQRVSVFYDQLFLKEPRTQEPTPLHHDLPYWPISGDQILSVWVPLDPVRDDSGAVRYVQGSHTWGKMYAPVAFSQSSGLEGLYEKAGLEAMPPEDELLHGKTLLRWDLEPGDVILHHPLVLHFSRGNRRADLRRRALVVRYLGDDVRFCARPATMFDNPKVRALLPQAALDLEDGDPMINEAFPVVWPRLPSPPIAVGWREGDEHQG